MWGFHTPLALTPKAEGGWSCSGPQLKHFILVYGDDESNRETVTVFGDDITTSDFLSDKLLMLEGGIQSCTQVCNLLMLKKPIIALSGLRGDKTRFGITETGEKKDYFTASGFLKYLKEKAFEQTGVSDEILNSWKDEYLLSHLLADPKRQDYDTKKKLIEQSWELFKQENLYLNLDLITFAADPLQRG